MTTAELTATVRALAFAQGTFLQRVYFKGRMAYYTRRLDCWYGEIANPPTYFSLTAAYVALRAPQ